MVGANTFRNPGLTAKLATTLDHLSGGRAVLGIGGAWFEREHDAFGIHFGTGFGERLDRLDEAVMLMRRLLDGERFSHEGRFYTFRDALCEPRPVQERLPILVGGSGPTKTLRTVARYADAWNGYGDAEAIGRTSATLRERCEEAGRPFEAIERTVTMEVVVRDTPEAAAADWAATVARHGIEGERGSDRTPRGLSAGGPPDAVAAYLRPFDELGVREAIWIVRNPVDRETIERLGEVRVAMDDRDRAAAPSHGTGRARP
jgi:alkanesulfonate monooxygenase SsuD/methylene tetrahydromethanopterin reductase-like flavin-dependent oxidoreductase (luciferase family)